MVHKVFSIISMSQVRCSHLLIKHEGSRNPVSRRTGASTAGMKKANAIEELQQWRQRIVAGEIGFAEAAQQRSDCGSFREGGDLGMFGRGAMQKPFEDATYALKVGELSGIVDTDSGVHIILRTA
jgi:parvulin-like peptidyl-prolyl isomerase